MPFDRHCICPPIFSSLKNDAFARPIHDVEHLSNLYHENKRIYIFIHGMHTQHIPHTYNMHSQTQYIYVTSFSLCLAIRNVGLQVYPLSSTKYSIQETCATSLHAN